MEIEEHSEHKAFQECIPSVTLEKLPSAPKSLKHDEKAQDLEKCETKGR